jgi:hypothetical protein
MDILESIILYTKAKLALKSYKGGVRTKKPRKFRRILRRKDASDQKLVLRMAICFASDMFKKIKTIAQINQQNTQILRQLNQFHEQSKNNKQP